MKSKFVLDNGKGACQQAFDCHVGDETLLDLLFGLVSVDSESQFRLFGLAYLTAVRHDAPRLARIHSHQTAASSY